ncbi:fasciclin domain-containing protein [Planktothrix sp. FACHB-1365]|uniref:fasciclin domain-containing protein n=1 Tax=Planktothrix sp. FACHB-1365 TaxID=2692855 RepID=UPI0016836C89|nr:fasciclin domain-containing protein [Planktothrix sp. FACHB-1365]MBD2482393.1 fasciclin domain-containing protein [Planktothrix sp. FACHB-1365]
MNNLTAYQNPGKRVGLLSLLSFLMLGTISPVVAAEAQISPHSKLVDSQDIAQLPIPKEVIKAVGGDLASMILSDERFTILAAILQTTGLLDALKKGDFTIFAPTDEAFAKLPQEILEAILKSKDLSKITDLLKYHVIPGKVTATDLKAGEVTTLEGDSITVGTNNNQIQVEDARVIDSDIPASNGVIHVIDKVMVLPE